MKKHYEKAVKHDEKDDIFKSESRLEIIRRLNAKLSGFSLESKVEGKIGNYYIHTFKKGKSYLTNVKGPDGVVGLFDTYSKVEDALAGHKKGYEYAKKQSKEKSK